MANKKRKQAFVPAPNFQVDEWPPTSVADWNREFALRISPKIESLIYHHPKELVEIILHLVNDFGEKNREIASAKVKEVFRLQLLRIHISPAQVDQYEATSEKAIQYCIRLASDMQGLNEAHPADLFKVIIELIKQEALPKITVQEVTNRIKHILRRQSGERGLIRKTKV